VARASSAAEIDASNGLPNNSTPTAVCFGGRGYLLARSAEAITVGEVVRFVESSRPGKRAERERKNNPFAVMWMEVDTAVSQVVDRTTFGDVVRQWRERQGHYVPNWDI
jgi:DNA-binding IscR family transcriptional regulator